VFWRLWHVVMFLNLSANDLSSVPLPLVVSPKIISVLYGYWIVLYIGFARFALLLHASCYFRAYQRRRTLHGIEVITKLYFAIFASFKESRAEVIQGHTYILVIHVIYISTLGGAAP